MPLAIVAHGRRWLLNHTIAPQSTVMSVLSPVYIPTQYDRFTAQLHVDHLTFLLRRSQHGFIAAACLGGYSSGSSGAACV